MESLQKLVFFGLPGQGFGFALDPLSLLFCCVLLPQIIAAALAGMARNLTFWAFCAGMALAVLAADACTLILGFELMSAASWLLVLRGDARPAGLYAGMAMFAAACLIPGLYLPPGNLAFVLIALGAGAKAGLAPLHAWLPRAHPAPPAGVSAVMSGGMIKVAFYILIRQAFLRLAPGAEAWWGFALIFAGAASVFLGALGAVLEVELKTVLAGATVEYAGLIAVALGLALRAKVLGDPALAAAALAAALLFIIAHALFKPLLFLGAGAVKHATGTTSLNWLGGLMRAMPRTGALMLAGAAGMAALPLGPTFAPEFLLLHATLAAAATGGIFTRILFLALLAVLGLGAALALAAAARIIGIGFLGRPRSLHTAAAEDAQGGPLAAMALLAAASVPVALLPGLVLRGLAPVLGQLVPGAPAVALDYMPLPLALLLLAFSAGAYLALQKYGQRGTREVPAWSGGFGRPPAWLPFGDPLTQPSASGLAEPLRRILGGARPGADPTELYLLAPLYRLNRRISRQAEKIRRATLRQRLGFVLAALIVALAALRLEQGS